MEKKGTGVDPTIGLDIENIHFLILCPVKPSLNGETEAGIVTQKLVTLLENTGFRGDHKPLRKNLHLVVGYSRSLDNSSEDKDDVTASRREAEAELNADIHVHNIDLVKVMYDWNYLKIEVQNKDKKSRDPPRKLPSTIKTYLPYSIIREKLKGHPQTIETVKKIRNTIEKKEEENKRKGGLFISIIDQKVVNFNGIYSSYLDIIVDTYNKEKRMPTVMTTGYEFSQTDKNQKLSSQIDMLTRITTCKHLPGCAYFPEPNFCYHLPPGISITKAKFYKTKDKQGNDSEGENKEFDRANNSRMEGPKLIRNIIELHGENPPILIFSDKAPIIIEATARFEPKKTGKYPTTQQSHFDQFSWSKALNYNRVLTRKLGVEKIPAKRYGVWMNTFKYFEGRRQLLDYKMISKQAFLTEEYEGIKDSSPQIADSLIEAAKESQLNVFYFRMGDLTENGKYFIYKNGFLNYIKICKEFWDISDEEGWMKQQWQQLWSRKETFEKLIQNISDLRSQMHGVKFKQYDQEAFELEMKKLGVEVVYEFLVSAPAIFNRFLQFCGLKELNTISTSNLGRQFLEKLYNHKDCETLLRDDKYLNQDEDEDEDYDYGYGGEREDEDEDEYLTRGESKIQQLFEEYKKDPNILDKKVEAPVVGGKKVKQK